MALLPDIINIDEHMVRSTIQISEYECGPSCLLAMHMPLHQMAKLSTLKPKPDCSNSTLWE